MGIMDVFQFKRKDEHLPDGETRDNYLKSLRRQSRMIDEKYEKERLLNKIKKEHERQTKENIFGTAKKSILNVPNHIKQKSHILKQPNHFKLKR